MNLNRRSGRIILNVAALAATVLVTTTAHGRNQAYRAIYEFQGGTDGSNPVSVPAVAKNGDLYGVTSGGGTYNLGTVFKFAAPRTRGGAWEETIVYDFSGGKGGVDPMALIIGADGNLYGVDASYSIFELSAPKSGDGVWKYHLLYTLNGTSEGAGIEQQMVLDTQGNLYGATQLGGDMSCEGGCGTVFELKRPTKNGEKWRLSLLHTFTGSSTGEEPFAGVSLDHKGNLYGTTNWGGTIGYGVAYRLTPPAKKGQPWNETVLYSFDRSQNIGSSPEGPVVFDSAGNLFGTTAFGGDLNCQDGFGCGVVYELAPPARKGGVWIYSTLYSFQGGNDGINPAGCLVFDSAGNLYGTTEAGGEGNGGTVYRMSASEGTWTETVLYGFNGGNGNPILPNGLTWGKWNDLYGATEDGGLCQGCGMAFEIRP